MLCSYEFLSSVLNKMFFFFRLRVELKPKVCCVSERKRACKLFTLLEGLNVVNRLLNRKPSFDEAFFPNSEAP